MLNDCPVGCQPVPFLGTVATPEGALLGGESRATIA